MIERACFVVARGRRSISRIVEGAGRAKRRPLRWMIIFLMPLCLLGHVAQQAAKFAENQCWSVRVSKGDFGEVQLKYCDNGTDQEIYLSGESGIRSTNRDDKTAADFLALKKILREFKKRDRGTFRVVTSNADVGEISWQQQLIMAVQNACIKDCKIIMEVKVMKSGYMTGSTNLVTKPDGSQKKRNNQTVTCKTNRSAPPLGPYHWPADTEVKVFFIRDMFAPQQRTALLEAMMSWTIVGYENGSGVRFLDAGDTTSRMSCSGCLTVGRKDVYKRDRKHYAFFYPLAEAEGRLDSAWIDLDFGITNVKALKGFMLHELGHGLGLWDCKNCKKKQTVMNRFPSMSSDNGLGRPSPCDRATVGVVYQLDRLMAKSKPWLAPR